MGWRDLLQANGAERIVSPWVGGRSLRSGARTWNIQGKLPTEHGWYTFILQGRIAHLGDDQDRELAQEPCVVPPGMLEHLITGYLVGDRLVPDDARVDPSPETIVNYSEPVYLIEPGLERFARVQAGRTHEGGPLIFAGQEMPLGAEEEVSAALVDGNVSVDHIKNVPPALDAAFRMELWQRVEAEKRRQELDKLRREEEAKRALEERRQKIAEQLGDAAGRRAMAAIDFKEAATAALAVGGATYLDHRPAYQRNEVVVQFRFANRRFECTCDKNTLRIIEAGICLTDHRTHEKGDNFFTLESLPGVIAQAQREHKLVVFRHVGEDEYDDDQNEDD